MKKPVNLTIKAHLLRGASYFLLWLAVGAISVGLAQQKINQSAADPAAAGPVAGGDAAGAITNADGIAVPTPTGQYAITQIGDSIVLGTDDIGNHGDDLVTNVALPFPYTL